MVFALSRLLPRFQARRNIIIIIIIINAAVPAPIPIFLYITSVLGAVVVDRSELKVMISMFNMEKSIYKDHFRISCSKILSIVVILQCPKMNKWNNCPFQNADYHIV